MNLRQLRTLVAIAEHRSFTDAGVAIGLSHSAVSLQVKALEEELGVAVVDRTLRPPRLTDRGLALVEQARRVNALIDEMRAIGTAEGLAGTLALGVVPTEMVHLLTPALAAFQGRYPRVSIRVRSALSGDLASAVRAGDLDAAVVTRPDLLPEGIVVRDIATERLALIAPASGSGHSEDESIETLVAGLPFIWFSRRTWAGQQIERLLAARGLRPREAMEIDALEAIEALVAAGLGVSIVPMRVNAPHGGRGVRWLPLDGADATRRLCLITRDREPRAAITGALLDVLREIAEQPEGAVTAARAVPEPGASQVR